MAAEKFGEVNFATKAKAKDDDGPLMIQAIVDIEATANGVTLYVLLYR